MLSMIPNFRGSRSSTKTDSDFRIIHSVLRRKLKLLWRWIEPHIQRLVDLKKHGTNVEFESLLT